MTVLAIDQGTTSTKAFLLYPDGRFEQVGSRRHAQIFPADGLVEHDADELLAHVRELVVEAAAREPAILGIALANQGETVVAFDRATGAPLHHAIVWQDNRTQGALDALAPAQRAEITAISGLPVDAYFSASKLRWLLDNVPGARALGDEGRLGLATSDAFFLARLAGVYATDATTASRTSLMSLDGLAWSPALCGIFGVPSGALPRIVPTSGRIGSVDAGGTRIPIVASVVDQQAALYGHGAREPGDLKITFGTGTFALAISGTAPARDAEGLVPTVAWRLDGRPPVYALDGGDYTAAAAVEWAQSVGLARTIEDFEMAGEASALERGLVFVPSLAGLAAPYWNRAAAGAFLGLRLGTTGADMRRAVLEGIALRAVELVEALTGGELRAVSLDGGLTRNRGFVQFLADALGRPVTLREHAELTALGAAELGYAGLGLAPPPRTSAADREIAPTRASPEIRKLRPLFASAIKAVSDFAARRAAGRA